MQVYQQHVFREAPGLFSASHWFASLLVAVSILHVDSSRASSSQVDASEAEVVSFGDLRYLQKEPVVALGFSSDGKLIASVGGFFSSRHEYIANDSHSQLTRDGRFIRSAVYLWNTADGKLLREIPIPETDVGVFSVAFTPDSSELIAASYSGMIRRWSTATGRLVWEQRIATARTEGVQHCVLAPDINGVVLGGSNGSIWVCNLNNGEQLAQWKATSGYAAALGVIKPTRQLLSATRSGFKTGLI